MFLLRIFRRTPLQQGGAGRGDECRPAAIAGALRLLLHPSDARRPHLPLTQAGASLPFGCREGGGRGGRRVRLGAPWHCVQACACPGLSPRPAIAPPAPGPAIALPALPHAGAGCCGDAWQCLQTKCELGLGAGTPGPSCARRHCQLRMHGERSGRPGIPVSSPVPDLHIRHAPRPPAALQQSAATAPAGSPNVSGAMQATGLLSQPALVAGRPQRPARCRHQVGGSRPGLGPRPAAGAPAHAPGSPPPIAPRPAVGGQRPAEQRRPRGGGGAQHQRPPCA